MTEMRILFTIPTPLPREWGVGTSVRRLARSMKRAGHTVALVQPYCEISPDGEDLELFSHSIYSLPSSSYPVWYRPRSWASALRSAYYMHRAIRAFQPDVIHVNFLGGIAVPLAILLRLPRRWRLVVTLRGSKLTIGPTRDSPLVVPWQERVIRRCNAVTAPSRAALQEALALYSWMEPKARVIYNALDMHALPRISEEQLLAPRRGVLFAGRLHPDKGVDVLLKAWRLLQDRGVTETLYICGDGREREPLQQLSHQLQLSSVEFLGRKEFKELLSLYLRATLLVLPSRSEVLGNVLVEAGYCGCVCIGTRIGGIPEVITEGETGFLVPPDDAESLAEAIFCFLQLGEEKQKAMRLQAHQAVKERFSAETEAQSYLDLFAQTIKARRLPQ